MESPGRITQLYYWSTTYLPIKLNVGKCLRPLKQNKQDFLPFPSLLPVPGPCI